MRAQGRWIRLRAGHQLAQPLQQSIAPDRLTAQHLPISHVRPTVPDRKAPGVRRPTFSRHRDDLLAGAACGTAAYPGSPPPHDWAVRRQTEQPPHRGLGAVGAHDHPRPGGAVEHHVIIGALE